MFTGLQLKICLCFYREQQAVATTRPRTPAFVSMPQRDYQHQYEHQHQHEYQHQYSHQYQYDYQHQYAIS